MEELCLSLPLVPSLHWFQTDAPIVFLGDIKQERTTSNSFWETNYISFLML